MKKDVFKSVNPCFNPAGKSTIQTAPGVSFY